MYNSSANVGYQLVVLTFFKTWQVGLREMGHIPTSNKIKYYALATHTCGCCQADKTKLPVKNKIIKIIINRT